MDLILSSEITADDYELLWVWFVAHDSDKKCISANPWNYLEDVHQLFVCMLGSQQYIWLAEQVLGSRSLSRESKKEWRIAQLNQLPPATSGSHLLYEL